MKRNHPSFACSIHARYVFVSYAKNSRLPVKRIRGAPTVAAYIVGPSTPAVRNTDHTRASLVSRRTIRRMVRTRRDFANGIALAKSTREEPEGRAVARARLE